jgi:wyosine [tRNA(Phe)-imidazoG37] synthetase (radical SAM superfamily)
MSLGVDLVPKKVCSLDCIYCEVGATTRLTLERKGYIPAEKVKAELEDFFKNNADPDYITFSGYGEPTLNLHIGDIIDFIKRLRPHIPVAVLTNGTLLCDPSVRHSLINADVVLPSLDAASEDVFRKINRPQKNLSAGKSIEGLVEFRKVFKDQIWLEVFILPGCNDGPDELAGLKEDIHKIKPDSVQINTLDRPGTEEGLRGATRAELQHVLDFLNMENAVIISAAPDRKRIASYQSDIESTILETIRRRPCTLDDLAQMLGLHVNEINKYLDVLDADGKVVSSRQDRGLFYRASDL